MELVEHKAGPGHTPWGETFMRAILANWLVTLAIFIANGALQPAFDALSVPAHPGG